MSNLLNPTSDDRGLDLLADLVAQANVETVSSRGWYGGRWNLRFGASGDCGFHVVLAGQAYLRTDDGVTETLQRGDIVLVRVAHQLASDLDAPSVDFRPDMDLSFQVDPSPDAACLLCGAYLLGAASLEHHPVFANLPPLIVLRAGDRDPAIDALITVLSGEFRDGAPGRRTIAARLIDAMLIFILRHWIERECPLALGWLRGLRDPMLARTLARIHHQYASPWNLDGLARAAGTSRASLARRFTTELGTSPIQFLTQRRLAVARQLATTTAMSLEEIAAEVGYASAFSLSKAFKRAFGEAPRRYVAAE